MRSFASSIKQHEAIRLDPDITRKIITSDGDVIIVIFDNIGYHIKVRRRHCLVCCALSVVCYFRGVSAAIIILYTSCTSMSLQQPFATTGFIIMLGSVHRSCRGHHTHKIATAEMLSLQSSCLHSFAVCDLTTAFLYESTHFSDLES